MSDSLTPDIDPIVDPLAPTPVVDPLVPTPVVDPLVTIAENAGPSSSTTVLAVANPEGSDLLLPVEPIDATETTAVVAAEPALPAIAGLTEDEVDRVAASEGLRLIAASTTGGYRGVKKDKHCPTRPYNAQIKKDGHCRSLGYFATAKEAALAYARAKGPRGEVADALAAGQAAIGAAAALEETEEDQLARAEGLTLLREDTPGGYKGVRFCAEKKRKAKPYEARIWREGKTKTLGRFATPKAAALCYARAKATQNAPTALAQPMPAEAAATEGDAPPPQYPLAVAVRIR